MNLQNKIVLVTGASSGIGQQTAIAFAKKGAKVIIHFGHNQLGAEHTKEKIVTEGGSATIYQADIANIQNIKTMFTDIQKDFGTIDILINNAGTLGPYGEFVHTSMQDISDLLQTNLIGTICCTQEAIKIFQSQQKEGVIINNTSAHANADKGGEDLALAYCMSKSALENFTKLLARQVAPHIRINAVAPGVTLTPIRDADTEELKQYMIGKSLIKRWITPEEIAHGCIFIAENDAMNGVSLELDGGFRA